jgi:hypothetical protein
MPELGNREQWEAKFAKELGKLLRRTSGEILELLGDPPNLDNIPFGFWDDIGEETSAILRKYFRRIYLIAAEELLSLQPVGVDWGLINEAAATWAESATFELISNLNKTSRKVVQKAVSAFYTEGQTLDELSAALVDSFGPVRAEMIAATEVTNASMFGEWGLIQELVKEGVTAWAFWETENDEFVDDEICRPLHGRPADGESSDGSPFWIHPDSGVQYNIGAAHTRCRCWIVWDFTFVPEGVEA